METEKEEWIEFIEAVKDNVRQHAGYFTWLMDRTIEEVGVIQSSCESLDQHGQGFFHSYKSRGENNDPPDCEAQSLKGEKIGIEVTELVDGASIAASKRKQSVLWEPWQTGELFELLRERITRKDLSQVKGGPYSQYILIIYSDEPRILDYHLIEFVRTCKFGPTRFLNRVFFLLSYSPWEKCCPYIELKLDGA
jgi:hypothetical protein